MIQVLIPTDFSDHAYNALSYAHMLFQEVETEFTLYHAYEASALQLVGNKSPVRLGTIYDSLEKEAIKKLEDLKGKISARNDISKHTYKIETYEGHLREGVGNLEKGAYDFIVMGSKGATGLKEIFVGSVTQSIVSLHQEIPLLIIPEKAFFRVPDNIGFATNYSRNYQKEELQPLLTLVNLWDSTVRMVEVYDEPGLNPNQKEHLMQLESLLMEINYRFHVVPEFSSIENCINVFNNELDIDLMVLIDYPKNIFERLVRESVVKKMAFHTTLPFLILPAKR